MPDSGSGHFRTYGLTDEQRLSLLKHHSSANKKLARALLSSFEHSKKAS